MSSVEDRVTLTDAAEAFINPIYYSDARRILILAALIAKDEGREVVRIGDMLAAHDAYWSRLGGDKHMGLWADLESLYTR